MSHATTQSRRIMVAVVAALLVIRIALLVFGFDRRPVITSNDEIYWAEPAWAMMHGYGYTMPCFAGTQFAESSAFHPPLYSALLMVEFKLFGFTIPALRGGPMAAHVLSLLVLLAIWWRLWRLGFLDGTGFTSASLLLLINFSTLSLARGGRPDSICIFFCLVPFLILVAGPMEASAVRRRSWWAAPWLGLALATHTVASFYFGIYLMALVALHPKLGKWRIGVQAAIPPLLFAGIWLAAFGQRWREALSAHLQIASWVGGAEIPLWQGLKVVAQGDWTYLLQVGGTTTFLILAIMPLLVIRWWLDRGQGGVIPWIWIGGAVALATVYILRMTGLKLSRGAVYLPLALTVFAVVTSHWPAGRWRRVILVGVGLFALADLAQLAFATRTAVRQWDQRSPHRFDHWLDRMAADAKVAVVPPMWFQARARSLDVRMIDLCIPPLQDYWMKTPDVFADRDFVIIASNHPLARDPRLRRAAQHETQMELDTELTLFVLNPEKFRSWP